MAARKFTAEEARAIGDQLKIEWSQIDLEQFRMGLEVELEHGRRDPETDVTHDDPIVTGKIALAHLREIPDYYTRLDRMEKEAEGKIQRIGDETMAGQRGSVASGADRA